MENGPVDEQDLTPPFVSKLAAGRQRFLAYVIDDGISTGRRTPADFVRHFPPAAIMQALVKRPDLRARILFATTGLRTPIGERKDIESAAEDVRIALEVGETDAETIVSLLAPDDRVRYFDAKALWAYVAEGDFWAHAEGIDLDIARAHVSFIVERALMEKLISAREIVEALGVERLAQALPRELLGNLLSVALERGRDKKRFEDEDVLSTVPVASIAEHVPLWDIWRDLVIRRIAEVQGFVDAMPEPETPAPEDGERTTESERPPAERAAEPPLSVEQAVRAFSDESTNDVIIRDGSG